MASTELSAGEPQRRDTHRASNRVTDAGSKPGAPAAGAALLPVGGTDAAAVAQLARLPASAREQGLLGLQRASGNNHVQRLVADARRRASAPSDPVVQRATAAEAEYVKPSATTLAVMDQMDRELAEMRAAAPPTDARQIEAQRTFCVLKVIAPDGTVKMSSSGAYLRGGPHAEAQALDGIDATQIAASDTVLLMVDQWPCPRCAARLKAFGTSTAAGEFRVFTKIERDARGYARSPKSAALSGEKQIQELDDLDAFRKTPRAAAPTPAEEPPEVTGASPAEGPVERPPGPVAREPSGPVGPGAGPTGSFEVSTRAFEAGAVAAALILEFADLQDRRRMLQETLQQLRPYEAQYAEQAARMPDQGVLVVQTIDIQIYDLRTTSELVSVGVGFGGKTIDEAIARYYRNSITAGKGDKGIRRVQYTFWLMSGPEGASKRVIDY